MCHCPEKIPCVTVSQRCCKYFSEILNANMTTLQLLKMCHLRIQNVNVPFHHITKTVEVIHGHSTHYWNQI